MNAQVDIYFATGDPLTILVDEESANKIGDSVIRHEVVYNVRPRNFNTGKEDGRTLAIDGGKVNYVSVKRYN